MKYEDALRFQKFLYNKVDLTEFSEAIRQDVPNADNGYILEKWNKFQKNHFGFIVNYSQASFEYLYNKMIESNYKG